MNELQQILADIQLAADAAKPLVAGNPIGAEADSLAQMFLGIAQKAILAHEAVTGQPIDLSLLHPIDPLT